MHACTSTKEDLTTMAVTPGNNNGPAQTTMSNALQNAGVAQASVGTGTAQTRSSGFRGGNTNGAVNLNARRPRPIARYGFSEVASKFLTAFQEAHDESIKDGDSAFKDMFRFHILDHQNLSIPLSMVCEVMAVDDGKGGQHAGVFTYVIAASNNRLANRFMSYGNNLQVEIDVVPGDVINPEMWNIVEGYLKAQYGSNVSFYNAGAVVLPREMTPDAKGDIHTAIYNGTQALYTVMDKLVGAESPLNLKDFQGTTIQGTVDLSPQSMAGLGGLPIRNDLGVSLNYVTRSQGLAGVNSDVVNGLTRVAGYVDLEYVGQATAPQPQQIGFQPFQPVPTQQYAPRYVITDLDTRTDAITMEGVLLGLISAGMVTQQWTWARAFEPRLSAKKSEIDIRDIGALGYVVNFGDPNNAKRERVDTRGTFGQQELINLLSFAVYDQPMVSMDIEEVGTLGWLHQAFIASVNGSQQAYQDVISAANALTNGVFGNMWDNSPIVRDDANRVHLGYYIGKDGERHDLREIDRLAILNLFGDRDMDIVYNWDRSWNDLNIPAELRLEIRAKLYKSALNGVEITGYARRVTFTTKFLTTLTLAAQQAGLSIQQTNMTMITQTGQVRPLYNTADVALHQQGFGANVFTMAGGNGYGAFRGGTSAFTGRFGG
jgi:hypothetical protein